MPHSIVPPTGQSSHRSNFVRLSIRSGVLRATLTGPAIREREAGIIAAEANEAMCSLGRRLRYLVLDFSSVQTVSSIGLGMTIDLRNNARKFGAGTIALGLNRDLMSLFRMMKVDRLCTIIDNETKLNEFLAR